MPKRYITIWFKHLLIDWLVTRDASLKDKPFVVAIRERNRVVIKEASPQALKNGMYAGLGVNDARVILPDLQVIEDKPELGEKLLASLCKWCVRFTPHIAIDPPSGLILDVSGCSHLWGGDELYLNEITKRLEKAGFTIRSAMADTIGAAWAATHFGNNKQVIVSGCEKEALITLPPEALRLELSAAQRLRKLGLTSIQGFIAMPRQALRRRFGTNLLTRLDQALGFEREFIKPLIPVEPYSERLQCLEPIVTATGIMIALEKLLEVLCRRLQVEGKGLRSASLKAFRIDGKTELIKIGTNQAFNDPAHLFKLFDLKISTIEPALGIELFVLEAHKTEKLTTRQTTLWNSVSGFAAVEISKLLDTIQNKIEDADIARYLPDQHHWPERSYKKAKAIDEKASIAWRTDRLRPVCLLDVPQAIEVTAPIPDYPPMMFRYKGRLHKVKKANDVERLEREWWIEEGLHRDYYAVEDEDGKRFWLYRSGHYNKTKKPQWFLHGFFS